MSRTIPSLLQTELDQSVQFTTRCLRFQLKNGGVFGMTMLDRDVVYDHLDGWGEVTYSAANGFDPSVISADTAYSVSNAEGRLLVADAVAGLTAEMVMTGQLDDAEWTCFLLNFRSPTPGRAAVLDAGDVGEVRLEDGMVIIPELLSYAMRLRQAVGHVWQRPCRSIFGSAAAAHTGCGVDADALWVAGAVVNAGAETDRVFTGNVAGQFPGRVEFLTGPNVGKRYAIESFATNTVTLADTTPFAIEPAHTYRIRPDCAKNAAACKAYGNYLNMKAEDHIPVGDGAAGSTPGAQLPGGGGWVNESVDPV